MATLRLPFVALVSCVFAAASQAADFDGSKPFLCSLIEAHDCAPGTACIKGLAEDLKLPQFVRIDFQARTFGARGAPAEAGGGQGGQCENAAERAARGDENRAGSGRMHRSLAQADRDSRRGALRVSHCRCPCQFDGF